MPQITPSLYLSLTLTLQGGSSLAQLSQDTIDKLCPSSCLHILWDSLASLMVEDFNNSYLCKELDLPFTESELNIAVSNLNSKSAPESYFFTA